MQRSHYSGTRYLITFLQFVFGAFAAVSVLVMIFISFSTGWRSVVTSLFFLAILSVMRAVVDNADIARETYRRAIVEKSERLPKPKKFPTIEARAYPASYRYGNALIRYNDEEYAVGHQTFSNAADAEAYVDGATPRRIN